MYPTINDLFEKAVSEHSELIALRMLIPRERKKGRGVKLILNEISYDRLGETVMRLAAALQELGVEKADKVALVSKPRAAWASAFFGILACGATVVPLDPELQPGEVERILNEAEVKAIVVSGGKAEEIVRIRESSHGSFAIISMDRPEGEDVLFLDALVIRQKPLAHPVEVSTDDLAILMYTSGTTGNAKGAMLTHGNIASNALTTIGVVALSSKDNFLSIVPWHHIYGLTITLVCPICTGGATTYAPVDRNLTQVMLRAKPTIILGVPKLYNVLYGKIRESIKESFVKRAIFTSSPVLMGKLVTRKLFGKGFRFFASGGAPLNPEVAGGLRDLGIGILEGYGLTETSPLLTASDIYAESPGMKPIAGVELVIDNPDENGVGEVVVRGPNVMTGYYKNPEATREVINEDGWFHTGDLGKLDEDGKLLLSGRAKNVIVLETGKNVYPEEIEWELVNISAIEEVMVYEGERQGAPAVSALVYPNWTYLNSQRIKEPEPALDLIWEKIRERSENLAIFKRIKNKDSVSLVDEPFQKSVKLDIKRFVYSKRE